MNENHDSKGLFSSGGGSGGGTRTKEQEINDRLRAIANDPKQVQALLGAKPDSKLNQSVDKTLSNLTPAQRETLRQSALGQSGAHAAMDQHAAQAHLHTGEPRTPAYNKASVSKAGASRAAHALLKGRH